MRYIGLVGAKESGKSTVCQYLLEKLPESKEIMMAGFLKEVCAKVFDLDLSRMGDPAYKKEQFLTPAFLTLGRQMQILREYKVFPAVVDQSFSLRPLYSVREILQTIGTELLRAVDKDIHLKVVDRIAKESGAKFIVCSDIRFPNEFNHLDNQEACMVYVSNPEAERAAEKDAHESEMYWKILAPFCDVTIRNHVPEVTKAELKNLVQEGLCEILMIEGDGQ